MTVRYPRSLVFPSNELALFTATSCLQGTQESHSHDFVETALVRSGRGDHVTVTGVQSLTAGSVVVVRPGSWHGYADCRDLVVTNCCFGPELLSRELAWLRADPRVNRLLWSAPGRGGVLVGSLPSGAVPSCGEALDRLAEALHPATAAQKVAAVGWLLVLLGALAEVTVSHGEVESESVPAPVVEAMRLLDADPAREWRVSDLSSRVLVGSAHLARLFKAHVGTSPMAYLSRLRAERAAALLCETDRTVSSVAALVGWPDPNYFSRAFRSHYGMSPSEYRRRRSPLTAADDHRGEHGQAVSALRPSPHG